MRPKRKDLVRLLSFLALAGAFLFWAGSLGAAQKLHLGMPTPTPNLVHIPPYVAQDLGFFKAEGLDVKISSFSGGTLAHQALVATGSDLDLGDIPTSLLMVGISKGSKMKVFYSFAAKNEALLVTAPEIKTIQQMKGKKVGIEGPGGYSHISFRSVAEAAGMKDTDFEYVRTAPPARVGFLLQGKLDAVVIHVEMLYQARKEKPVNEIARIWRTQPDYFYAAFGGNEDKIRSMRGAYVGATRAMIKATRAIYQEPEKALAIAKKYCKFPPDALEAAYKVLKEDRIWSVNAGLPKRSIEYTHKLNIDLKRYEGTPPPAEGMFDFTIAQDAVKTLGLWGKDQGWDPEH